MKLAAIAAVLILALAATVSAVPLVAAGPADYGYADEVPPLGYQEVGVEFGVGAHQYMVGETAKAELEMVNANTQGGFIDGYLHVPRQHIPAGQSYEVLTTAAFHAMYLPYEV